MEEPKIKIELDYETCLAHNETMMQIFQKDMCPGPGDTLHITYNLELNLSPKIDSQFGGICKLLTDDRVSVNHCNLDEINNIEDHLLKVLDYVRKAQYEVTRRNIALGAVIEFLKFNGYEVGANGGIPKLGLKGPRIVGTEFSFINDKWKLNLDDPRFFEKLGDQLNEIGAKYSCLPIEHQVPDAPDQFD